MKQATITISVAGRIDIAGRPRASRVVLPAVIAETEEDRIRGLSFTPRFTRAMIFPHHGEKRVEYNFVNMLVPLDIVAADVDGIVRDVAARVMPRTPNMSFGPYPVSLVIEMPAGWLARYDIKRGDRVETVL